MSHPIAFTRQPGGLLRTLNDVKSAALALLVLLVAACGGEDAGLSGGAPQAEACADCGTALLTITDAPGDFQSYAVDVTSLSLQKLDGTTVQALPASTRIDFAELVDLGEVLSAWQVPAGVYVGATLRVDYSDADIVVEDALGGSLAVQPVDAAGAPLGTAELNVRLDGRNRLLINPRQVSHLAFDLNLEASNTVNLASGTVTVSPFIVAGVLPPEERDWRARGALTGVDVAGSSYSIRVRPFHHHEVTLGELTVFTTGTTAFEIDGTTYTGAAGLTQLDTLADDTMVVAFGSLDMQTFRFTAQRVLAGASVDDLRRHYLSGNVLARRGDTLLVGGVRLFWGTGAADPQRHRGQFLRETVTLQVGPRTKVTHAGQGAGVVLDEASISVGQRIQAIGDASRNPAGSFTMDATGGLVRLNHTFLSGRVTASEPGKLTLDLESLHGLRPARFDFTGTGQMPTLDADPRAYEVAVRPGLDTALHPAGSLMRLSGFVAPFGMAPPDFNAVMLSSPPDGLAAVEALWLPGGSAAPFSVLSAAGLSLDPAATPPPAGAIRMLDGVIRLDAVPGGLALVPATDSARRAYAIAHRPGGRIENFSDFGDFATALDAALDGGSNLFRLHAYGTYDVPAGRFAARQLLVVVSP